MEAMINNLVKAIGWSILHSLWQGAIIYALLFAVLMIWPKISARIKHNLAFGSLFLIFASFCFTFGSIFQWPSAAPSVNSIVITPAIYQRLSGMANSLNAKTEAYFPIVVIVYIIGILFQLVVLSSSYAKLKKLKQAHVDAIPAHWKPIFELTLAQLKIKKRVQFYLSSRVNVPLVIGFFKPVVLFPIALATQLDTQQVEAILIHELSHIRRNDYLINLAKTFIETLLFFNPFVWLTTKFIHIEREHACDDLVVNFTGSPITYAHALLKLELLKDKQSPALALAATGNNQHLYQRIKRITAMKTNYINAKQQFFILTLAIATVVSLAWMNPSKSVAAKPKKAQTLLTVKVVPSEGKPMNNHLIVVADTDTAKSKKKTGKIRYTTNQGGTEITYTSIDEMPDSIKTRFLELQKKFSSPEWKERMAKIEFNSKELEKKFNSKEWKDKMAKIEFDSKELEKKYNSPEWKEKMAKMEQNSKELEKKFNSPEWKDKMAKIEFNSKELEKKYNSPEWKEKMAKLEFNSKELEKKFNSKEWKDKMAKIEFNSKELEKKFNSPEWKEKMEQYRKLQESPEYKELRKKYESDLEELKKKKGIKTDKTFLMFDTNNTIDLSFLPSTKAFESYFTYTTLKPMVLDSKNTFKFEELAPAKFKEAFKNSFKMEGNMTLEMKTNDK
ncbi:M56 family metallopeptidase [Pedobacter sp. KR3-3]|uniref:M56 family metallopeptidase n=1 Tax=Pedobacter albus TaxID=3113905 RepID=A0ABU7I7F4_9SPHI|nr:M56 family metallopeptidase [Pedobacter sp. KR3-3]MEE1945408.1 M56 family metallopeptidase [Pedobacter sp. KR3-3]